MCLERIKESPARRHNFIDGKVKYIFLSKVNKLHQKSSHRLNCKRIYLLKNDFVTLLRRLTYISLSKELSFYLSFVEPFVATSDVIFINSVCKHNILHDVPVATCKRSCNMHACA